MAACQVVEEECEDEWNKRRVNIPGIGNVPLIAAVSDSRSEKRQIINKRNKHTSYGEVNNVRVELLRDSGSSVSVVRSALVAPEQFTGKQVTCLLVDNCVKNCPQAVVEVDTKYYMGRLPVVCMERCIYDLILGNDIYEHTSERYEVKQTQAEGAERIVDMIFENSKLRSGSPQLEAVCEKNIKPTSLTTANFKPTAEWRSHS